MRYKNLTLVLLLLLSFATSATAQLSSDSIAASTHRLRTGSMVERVVASGDLLHKVPPTSLPPDARRAVVEELNRLNEALLHGEEISGLEELVGEDFGEYYLDLVVTVAALRTPTAEDALVMTVDVGRGLQQRVARQGDRAVPRLVEMIGRGYQDGGAIETLALAWFWADRTGAELSEESRVTIVRELTAGSRTGRFPLRLSTAVALGLTGDPAFLALARDMEKESRGRTRDLVAFPLTNEVVPALTERARTMPLADLVARVERITSLVCTDAAGARANYCRSLEMQMDAARRHVAGGRPSAARQVLGAVAARADQALEEGVLDPAERALVAGGAEMLLERI